MSYVNAKDIFPAELMELIQKYVEGETIYIPKKEASKKPWGSKTSTRLELAKRNHLIYEAYIGGQSTQALAQVHFLSVKSIQRIVLNERNRRKNMHDTSSQ